jgi:hypothetical protein
MDITQKKQFVATFCDSIKVAIIKKIEARKIPDNWDGIEIHLYISEKFQGINWKFF